MSKPKTIKSPTAHHQHSKLNNSSSSNRLFRAHPQTTLYKKNKTPDFPVSSSIKKPSTNSSLFRNFSHHLRLRKQDSRANYIQEKQIKEINENIENESSHETLDLVKKINQEPVKRAQMKSKRLDDLGVLNTRGDMLSNYISSHVMQNYTAVRSRYLKRDG